MNKLFFIAVWGNGKSKAIYIYIFRGKTLNFWIIADYAVNGRLIARKSENYFLTIFPTSMRVTQEL